MKTTKSKPNVKLLRKIQKHILKEPRRFFMDWYIARKSQLREDTFASDNGTRQEFAPCGTAACIAGWACLLSGNEALDFHRTALHVLNIRDSEPFRAHVLFDVNGWAQPFQSQYKKAKKPEARAEIAASRIEYFIKTGE